MVSYAITVARGRRSGSRRGSRIPSYAVWETVVFALNILAFIFIGLQIRPILDSPRAGRFERYLAVAGAVLVTVILVRVAWHMAFNAVMRWRDRAFGFKPTRLMLRPTVGSGLVIAWAGMRGIVSLAAALALPSAFPYRDLIVTDGVLGRAGHADLQGLTSAPLAGARSEGRRSRRPRTPRRARARPAGRPGRARTKRLAPRRLGAPGVRGAPHERRAGVDGTAEVRSEHTTLHREALKAARDAVLAMRGSDEIGDDAFHEIEEELDWLEMADGRKEE